MVESHLRRWIAALGALLIVMVLTIGAFKVNSRLAAQRVANTQRTTQIDRLHVDLDAMRDLLVRQGRVIDDLDTGRVVDPTGLIQLREAVTAAVSAAPAPGQGPAGPPGDPGPPGPPGPTSTPTTGPTSTPRPGPTSTPCAVPLLGACLIP